MIMSVRSPSPDHYKEELTASAVWTTVNRAEMATIRKLCVLRSEQRAIVNLSQFNTMASADRRSGRDP